jgi:hypothetical protein
MQTKCRTNARKLVCMRTREYFFTMDSISRRVNSAKSFSVNPHRHSRRWPTPSPPQDDPAGEDVPPPPIGWTVKTYHKPRCDTASHHRLVGILIAYYVDWDPTVEYVCNEYTHPLEDTY